VDLFRLITEKILTQEPVPVREQGYVLAVAHRASWWTIQEQLAQRMHARELITDSGVKVWPSDDMASEFLGWPRAYVRAMGTAG
jgi:hypothetical protein